MESPYTIRAATPADVDAVAAVALTAMTDDPQWNYRFVHRKEFPEDHYKYTRLLYEQFISPANDDWCVMLAETRASSESGACKTVAFAIWDVSYINKAKKGPGYEPQNPMGMVARAGGTHRRDVAPHRQAAFRAGCDEEDEKLQELWGDQQLHLQILGVHPDHRRHAIGSQLTRWGIDKATHDHVPVTVIAGPMGLLLYSRLGFQQFGTFITQAPGEEEKIDSYGMVYETKPKPQGKAGAKA